MKFAPAFKLSTLAASALLSASAFASGPDYEAVGGSAGLTFSNNALAALTTSGVSISAIAPATYVQPNVALEVDVDGTSWNDSYDVTTIGLVGGFILNSSSVAGARATVSNLSFDVASGVLYGDIVTQSWSNPTLGSYVGQTFGHQAMFYGTRSGSSNIEAGNGNVSLQLNNLYMTSSAIPVLGNALGVAPFLYNAIFPTLNFGNSGVAVQFVPTPVPEPSAALMLGLGLAALVGVQSVRRKAGEPQA